MGSCDTLRKALVTMLTERVEYLEVQMSGLSQNLHDLEAELGTVRHEVISYEERQYQLTTKIGEVKGKLISVANETSSIDMQLEKIKEIKCD